jgi:hypothetical protein
MMADSATIERSPSMTNIIESDDDRPDYESSPIDQVRKKKKLVDGGWRVEELPQIPIQGNMPDPPRP